MARLVLDVPKEKIQSIIHAISQLGIDNINIHSQGRHPAKKSSHSPAFSLRKIASSFILFDWEFFSNELEYE
ncbi:MAG: hypothetical protein K2Q21_16100 [Chitinophagaceae bacterium]|nr:hypothetical protein [Chitinophagaceae bacterium]